MTKRRKTNNLIKCLTKKKYFNKQKIPIDINNLIFSYVDTKKCKDCGFIENNKFWLQNKRLDIIDCPNCNRRCFNCDIIYFEQDTEEIICNDEEKTICKGCLKNPNKFFYCEGCSEHYCKCFYCNGEFQCEDCETKYCSGCFSERKIILCQICQGKSCCIKFTKIKHEWIGECCLMYFYPHRCSR